MNKWILLIALPLSLTAFASQVKKATVTPKEEDAPGAKEVVDGKVLVHNIRLDDYLKNLAPDEIVEKMDSMNKNKPDIFIVFHKNDDGTKMLLMQLFDLNRDGKIDLVKHFQKGKLVRTEVDLDYDGLVDVVSEYDPQSGELKRKIQANGTTNIWKYYFHNELRKKEVDRNSDGKPDMWVYYRNGKVIRTEVDQNFDGKIIRIDGPLNPNKDKKATSAKASGISE